MKALVIVLLGTSAVFGQTADPARTLYDLGVRDEIAGRYTRALLDLETLVQTYPDHALAAPAKTEIAALQLFNEAVVQLRAGKLGTAFVSFRAVSQVYPESPLAKQADAIGKTIDPGGNEPVVRELELRGPWPMSADEIHQRFSDREIPVGLEMPYQAQQVERARTALEELLAEHGQPNQQVRADTAFDRGGSAYVIFTLAPVTGRQSAGPVRRVERSLAMLRRVVPFTHKKPANERT